MQKHPAILSRSSLFLPVLTPPRFGLTVISLLEL